MKVGHGTPNFMIMRKNIVAGNWKMNTTLYEGVELADEINEKVKEAKLNCDVVICVPFTHLTSIAAIIDQHRKGSKSCENLRLRVSFLFLIPHPDDN